MHGPADRVEHFDAAANVVSACRNASLSPLRRHPSEEPEDHD